MKIIATLIDILRSERFARLTFYAFFLCLVLSNVCMFFTEPLPLIVRLTNLILPPGIILLVLTVNWRCSVTYLWLLPLLAFNAFQIVILYLFGQSPVAVDMFLNVATTNPTEANELLYNLLPSLVVVFVLYVSTIGTAIWMTIERRKFDKTFLRRNRKIARMVTIVGALLLGGCYINDHDFEIEDDIFPVNVTYNLCSAVIRYHEIKAYPETSADVTFGATDGHESAEKEVYVLVVGETARAANFQLYGYERPTTPNLWAMRSELVYFPDALTQCNTTHKAVPMILSPVSAENFNDIKHIKSFITAFNEAGYRTAYISNQRRNGGYIDFFGEEAQMCKFLKDSAELSDTELLVALRDELAAADSLTTRQLVVLHMYGSHFNYSDRYSVEDACFTPDKVPGASTKYRKEIVNAYDNTIRFTDRFVANVIAQLKDLNCKASMIYLSDHGEDIYDDARNRFLHASPWPTYYQMHVPLVVWSSAQYREAYPEVISALESNSAKPVNTSRIVSHTLMHMAGLRTAVIDETDAVSSQAFEAKQRLYLDDHNEGHTLDDIPLHKLDIEAFKAHGIVYP